MVFANYTKLVCFFFQSSFVKKGEKLFTPAMGRGILKAVPNRKVPPADRTGGRDVYFTMLGEITDVGITGYIGIGGG